MRDVKKTGSKKGIGISLQGVNNIFLDTAPLIYYVEKHPKYLKILKPVFQHIDKGFIKAVTSPVTLAECLIHPYRRGLINLQKDFTDLIVDGRNTTFMTIDHIISQKAAQLRASYNLTLTDAFQVATAISAGCDTFLTNDQDIKQVTEIEVLVLTDLSKK
ncbi:MAG: PIN domain-containing protein [Syntrophaceae bacterium]|nr:PIN domain-containing protein [Syntrophaceae bacterium]